MIWVGTLSFFLTYLQRPITFEAMQVQKTSYLKVSVLKYKQNVSDLDVNF
jgi:hypothetical protein